MEYLIEKKESPHSILAEKILLTELLLHSRNLDIIFSRLNCKVFYLTTHRLIYEAAYRLFLQGKDINITTVVDELAISNLLEASGGSSFLLELINDLVPSGNIETYIILLLDKFLRRSLLEVASQIAILSYNSSDSIEFLFESAEQLLSSLTQTKPKSSLLPASEVLLETFLELEKAATQGLFSGVSSGFFDLDILTQGFQKSDLIIVAGRPSMGKTAFALNLARNISEVQPFPVTIFSLEMSRQQIIYRFLSIESQIINSRLRSGDINPEEWYLLSKAISYLATLKIYLDDSANNSLPDIRSKLNRLKSNTGQLGAVIIDYLQLITDTSYKDNRVQELSRITRNLKILAREFDIPIIVLSQLSRNVESRNNKRPLLSDLRESGCLAGENKLYHPSLKKSIALNSVKNQIGFEVLGKMSNRLDITSSFAKQLFSTGSKIVHRLLLFGFYNVVLTSNHKLLTTEGWVATKYLKQDCLIAIFDRFNVSKRKLPPAFILLTGSISFLSLQTSILEGKQSVFDVWIPALGNFLSNDIFVHNSIEQDADVVLMLYRENYYSPDLKENNVTEIIIAKQRNGPIGTINLIFDPKLVSFSNFVLFE